MPIHNADIAAALDQIADLLELRNDNPFRIRAYRNAARTVGAFGQDIKSVVDRGGELPKLPGIGPDLTGKIHEITANGTCKLLEELRTEFPPAVTELLKLPGLGPKRVKALYDRLKVQTLEELRDAANAERIRGLPGFGAKTEEHILQVLGARADGSRRFKLATAMQYAEPLVAYLAKCRGVQQVTIAGSYRRMRETIGDLDIVISASRDSPAMQTFCDYDEVREVVAHGETRASVVLKAGLQVDLRLVPRESYGAALHYFTGSKAHNIAIRRIGQSRGLKINEYGVFSGDERIAGGTEASVFESVGLPYIPPELREDRGEIEAARRGELPKLVALADLKGDLHLHTKASDGHHTLEEMAIAARGAGLEYIAVTEHSRRLAFARGLDPQRLSKQADEIDRLNAKLEGIAVLKGIEVDILEDGTLDLPDSALERLDIVVGAVHGGFDLPRRRQTERILRALENRYLTILAHPSGRLIGKREPYDIDMLAVIRRAKARGCALELNANPERLDLNDVYCQMARDEGALLCIDSDAHSTQEFGNLGYGIGQGRRGWLEAKDVLNTRPLMELRKLLDAGR